MAETTNETFYLLFRVDRVDKEKLKQLLLELESVMGMVPLRILDEREKPIVLN